MGLAVELLWLASCAMDLAREGSEKISSFRPKPSIQLQVLVNLFT